MTAGMPFMMVTEDEVGRLSVLEFEPGVKFGGIAWVIDSIESAGVEIGVDALKEDRVIGSDLSFEANGGGETFELVVFVFAGSPFVERFCGITESVDCSVANATDGPISFGAVAGSRKDAASIAIEEARVFLL